MQTEQSKVTNDPSFWALLVGIDEYQAESVPKLNGCVNDVEAMRIFLLNQLGVPEDHIRLLTNQQASRSGLISAFERFLIDNPSIAFNDQILFHYSGHGSQMPDTTGVEPDGYNETIVPYDSRTSDIYDIPDKTLAALLARLAERKGNNITVILDSCHSGSGTRRIELPGTARARLAPADNRLPPADLDADLLASTSTRSAGPSGWATTGISYVLLAGCRDSELSNEYWSKSVSQEGVWHGALTYFTLQALGQVGPNTTYAELHERVAARVNAIYRDQTPQCEGNRDRVIFEGMQVQHDHFITVQQIGVDTITLGAGLVHGLRPGTELALYPPETRTRNNLLAPLAIVEVVHVAATTAQAQRKDRSDQAIPLHARGLITKQVYAGLSQTVALLAEEGEENEQAIARLRQVIQPTTPERKSSPYVEVVNDPPKTAELYVVASAGKLYIYNANGVLLVEPRDIDVQSESDAVSVLHALENIVRYHTVLALSNEGQASRLAGKAKLRLRHVVTGQPISQAQELPAEAIGSGGELTVYFYADQPDRNLYVVDVTNKSSLEIYPHVFTLSPDYSIQRLYPRWGQQEAVRPGLTFPISDQLTFFLPPGWDASRDYLKAIITTVPTDLQMLEQKGLTVPPPSRAGTRSVLSHLDQLLDAVLYGAGTRFAGPAYASIGEDWTVVELPITTVRAFGTVKLDASAQEIPLSDGLTLIKPKSFQGEVTVTTWGQAIRGIDGDPALAPPPGLVQFPDLFQPLGRTGTRSVGPSGLVVALNVDEASRQSITQNNPLRLKLPLTPGEQGVDLFVVAFDGEDYLLVGSSEHADTLKVIHLPPTTVVPTRGIGHAIKLFIYKKTGRYTPIIGLHRAELEDGKVVYSEVRRKQFQPGQRVAVFIHGFTSDTRWMIQGLAQFLRKEVLPYDHLLTWDYESFATSVQEIGTQFALALQQQCGFDANDGITVHVYAHSMGCLVSRYMVELAGGFQFVDRLVMAGPPNQGTTLATLSRGFVYLATALINHFSIIPPIGVIDWALKELYGQGMGWGDLVINSQVEQQLNALKEPSNVPYLALIGENVPDEQERNRLNRLARKVLHDTLDGVFGEPNDMVIGVSSMKGVRGGAYPICAMNVLPCDHFHYYDIPQGLATVKQWISH